MVFPKGMNIYAIHDYWICEQSFSVCMFFLAWISQLFHVYPSLCKFVTKTSHTVYAKKQTGVAFTNMCITVYAKSDKCQKICTKY
jgi:hypothetical protein